MDTSKEYIEMCQKARPVQIIKFEKGFVEGDYVECDGNVRIIGHDFISLDEKLKINPWNIFRFAMLSSDVAGFSTINNDHLPYETELKYGEYTIEYIKNPLWLPYQDQLQDIIGKWSVAYALFDFWKHEPLYFIGDRPYYPFNVFGSLEQCWLAFVMHEKYGNRWDGSKWVIK